MLASSLMIMPINYRQAGLLSSLIASVIIAFVSYKTCSIIVRHHKPEESGVSETVKRALGRFWQVIFALTSLVYLVMLGGSMVIIILNMFDQQIFPFVFNGIVSDNETLQGMNETAKGVIFFVVFLLALVTESRVLNKINFIGFFTVFLVLGVFGGYAVVNIMEKPLTFKK